jgi:hypothetical protein
VRASASDSFGFCGSASCSIELLSRRRVDEVAAGRSEFGAARPRQEAAAHIAGGNPLASVIRIPRRSTQTPDHIRSGWLVQSRRGRPSTTHQLDQGAAHPVTTRQNSV